MSSGEYIKKARKGVYFSSTEGSGVRGGGGGGGIDEKGEERGVL